jgi:hypothetical protein
MNTRGHRLCAAALLVAPLGFASPSAFAGASKDQCITANGNAQELRRDRKLSAAREQLHICADASCPTMVRDDCIKRLDELERAQPSIVFNVKDTKGTDVIDVRVSVDGRLLADHLDGSALMVDPGVHVFSFEVTGQPPVTDRLLIREGEIGRQEPIVIGSAGSAPSAIAGAPATSQSAAAAAPPPEAASTPAINRGSSSRRGLARQKVVGLVLGGVGVAGLAIGTTFGLRSGSAWSTAKDVCGGNPSACTNVPSGQSYRITAERDATISTVGFIAGGVLAATGVVLFFTAGPEKSSTTGVVIGPSLGPRQAAVVLGRAFQ